MCGKEAHDLAHLFVCNKLRTRWDKRNCHALCRTCHATSHSGDDIYSKAYIEKESEEAYSKLRLDSNTMVGNVRAFMEETERKLNDG